MVCSNNTGPRSPAPLEPVPISLFPSEELRERFRRHNEKASVVEITKLEGLKSDRRHSGDHSTPLVNYTSTVETACTNPLVIRVAHAHFNIVVPRVGSRARSYVTFSKAWPFGTDPGFGRFIKRRLREAKKEWRGEAGIVDWLVNKKLLWKNKVMKDWRFKVERTNRHERTRAARRNLNTAAAVLSGVKSPDQQVKLVSPMISRGIRSVYVVRLPDFAEFKSGKSRSREV